MFYDIKTYDHISSIGVMDKNHSLVKADERVYTFLGESSIPHMPDYIHNEDKEAFEAAVQRCFETGGTTTVNIRLKSRTGGYLLVIAFIKPNRLTPNKLVDLELYDVPSLVERFNSLDDSYKRISAIMQILNPMAVFEYLPKTGMLSIHFSDKKRSYSGSLEQFKESLLDKNYIEQKQMTLLNKFFDDLKTSSAASGAGYRYIVTPPDRPGKSYPVLVRTVNYYEKDCSEPSAILGAITVNQTMSSLHSEDEGQVKTDQLTGLYNKMTIKDMAMDALIESKGTVTFLMMDLDRFKEVNDTYGHMFGDDVICNTARIIKDTIGDRGVVGRTGGDEFFAVLKDAGEDLEQLRPILRAIRSSLEWAYKGKLNDIKLTLSLGCATYPKDADNYNDLFKLADRCLYFAKTKGRNRFVVYDKEKHGSLEEIKTEDSSIVLERAYSDVQKLNFAADAVQRLTDWGEDAINPVLDEFMPYFYFKTAAVYNLSKGEAVYGSDSVEQGLEASICSFYDEFKEALRNNDLFAYGDILNLKIPYPRLYEFMLKNDYQSLVIYAVRRCGKVTHLCVACTKGRHEKWSDTDRSIFHIVFKTLGDKVKR